MTLFMEQKKKICLQNSVCGKEGWSIKLVFLHRGKIDMHYGYLHDEKKECAWQAPQSRPASVFSKTQLHLVEFVNLTVTILFYF